MGGRSSYRREEAYDEEIRRLREVPSEMNCTVGIAADSEDELIEAAVQHAVAVHSHEDTEELRTMIRKSVKETEAAAV
jgi:predicted small metal-binding protein